MTSIFARVITALNTLSPAIPFALAPYKGTLPATYITYELISGVREQSADNAETGRSYMVQISVWSISGLDVLPDVTAAMIAAGFQAGEERQLPQDQGTSHYGLAKDYVYFG